MTDRLALAVVDAARSLPPRQVERLAAELARHDRASDRARITVPAAVATPAFRQAAYRILDAWRDLPGEAVALALRSAARAATVTRAEQSIDVVWTGPQSREVPVRLTRAVLLDVIRAARERLIVVSFTAYRVAMVVEELAAAAARGVDVRLVLESPDPGGPVTRDATAAFASLGEAVTFWVWPAEQRPPLPVGRAALHAKAAIADDHSALVTSANLTGHGINENMELGLLIHGGLVPRRLSAHFQQLMRDRVLVTASADPTRGR
jgi:phosphatidylserine/phosphatidylglycerophosphate/cardiolipin synthase-like enzyme